MAAQGAVQVQNQKTKQQKNIAKGEKNNHCTSERGKTEGYSNTTQQGARVS